MRRPIEVVVVALAAALTAVVAVLAIAVAMTGVTTAATTAVAFVGPQPPGDRALIRDYVGANVVQPPPSLGFDPFYKKYADALGIPILASEKVPDAALLVRATTPRRTPASTGPRVRSGGSGRILNGSTARHACRRRTI